MAVDFQYHQPSGNTISAYDLIQLQTRVWEALRRLEASVSSGSVGPAGPAGANGAAGAQGATGAAGTDGADGDSTFVADDESLDVRFRRLLLYVVNLTGAPVPGLEDDLALALTEN